MAELPERGADIGAWKRYVLTRLNAVASDTDAERRVGDLDPFVLEELATLVEEAHREAIEEGIAASESEQLGRSIERRVGSWQDLHARLAARPPQRQLVDASSAGNDATRASAPPEHATQPEGKPGPFAGLGLDLKAALRSLSSTPTLTVVAAVVLALGIGATTGLFSLLDAVLLEPLPYAEAERLGIVQVDAFGRTGVSVINDSNTIDFQEAATLEGIEVFALIKVMMTTEDTSRLVTAARVTPGMLELLGVDVLQGRDFDERIDLGEDRQGNVILSAQLWEEQFGSDPAVIGSTIRVSEEPVQVVGVLPSDFRFLVGVGWREHNDIWMVMPRPEERGIIYRRHALVRLADGATFDEAGAELNLIAERSKEIDVELQLEGSPVYKVQSLEENLAADLRPALFGVFMAAMFVLLLVCANVAHLLLVRGLHRQTDWALRRSLGASRWRLTRHGLLESLLLATLGGVLGLGLAALICRGVPLLPGLDLPRLDNVRLDREVLLFSLVATLGTALLSGLLPSLYAARSGGSWLREKAGLGSGRRSRVALVLVAGQIAIAIVLLAASGALLRTLLNLGGVDPGYEAENVLAFDFSLNRDLRTDNDARLRFNRELLEWLEARPEIESASVASQLPFTGSRNLAAYATDADSEAEFGDLTGSFHRVLPRYFETMGIPLLGGRDFIPADTDNAAYVAVISESLARTGWPDGDAIGKSILIEFAVENGTQRIPTEVIGIVGDVHETDLRSVEFPQVYLPYWPTRFVQDYVVRSSLPPMRLTQMIDIELKRRGDGLVVDDAEPMTAKLARESADTRVALLLLGAFALMALVISCLGIYGALSYAVSRRSAEIGLRMALGATAGRVLRSTILEGLSLTAAGLAVGLLVAFWALRSIESFLFGVSPTDAGTLVAVALVLLASAALASAAPARRATRIAPTEALRSE